VDDLAAHRRRVILGAILAAAFALLIVAALIPSPQHRPLTLEQAGADETVPADSSSTVAPTTTSAPRPTPTTEAPATTSTTSEPVTTTTTDAPTKTASIVKATSTPKPAVTPPPVAATPPPSTAPSDAAFLACIRMRESHNDYTTVSASGNYRGAYQFNQSAWDASARHAGRLDLVGQLANLVSPADQDAVALDLYHWQGAKPWGNACT
jgi:cytoskeletal protein RodZ